MQNNMKTALLTRRYGYNFGSSLQAYAMRLLLESLGQDVRVLNYDEFSQHLRWKIKPLCHSVIIPFIRVCEHFGISTSITRKVMGEYHQKKKFREFDRFFISPTKEVLRARWQLAKEVKDVHACVCGSDQIWNTTGYDKHCFLDFCRSENLIKIAYAPSFGISELNDHIDDIRRFLNDFDFLSVRELQGKHIVEQLTGRNDCHVVLDPTMMVPAQVWKEKKKDYFMSLPSKYIACYFLGNQYIPYRFISKVAEILNCPIVNVTTFRTPNDIKGIQENDISPFEFLNVIDNAQCVLTDSFHATIFSILFRKNFYSFNKHENASGTNENSRLYSLLSLMDLQSRHIVDNEAPLTDYKDICYDDIEVVLSKEKEASLSFLQTALEYVKPRLT